MAPELAIAVPDDREIHGDGYRLVPRGLGALDQRFGDAPLVRRVELEPRSVRSLRDILDGPCREGRTAMHDPGGSRSSGYCNLALVVGHPVEPRRRQGNRERDLTAQHRGLEVDLRETHQDPRTQPATGERGDVVGDREFATGSSRDVGECLRFQRLPGRLDEIIEGQHLLEIDIV